MDIGLLWYDNDPKLTLSQRLSRAAEYCENKYNIIVDHCELNPVMETKEQLPSGITVLYKQYILPNYFWVGKEKENEV